MKMVFFQGRYSILIADRNNSISCELYMTSHTIARLTISNQENELQHFISQQLRRVWRYMEVWTN